MKVVNKERKPEWLRVKVPSGQNFTKIKYYSSKSHLSTVCEEAKCPNMGDCWKSGTATFMLMGNVCTRACRFCSVKTAKNPPPLDSNEPDNLAETLKNMNLKYAVLTTVDRDDLVDQGAEHIKTCVDRIRENCPELMIELLIPDFQGKSELIKKVAFSGAQVIGHNLECTRKLTRKVRDVRAGYDQSLFVLEKLREMNPDIHTKSSLMLGFGETEDEVIEAMRDIRKVGTNFLTLGQYLQPDKTKLPVIDYIHPDRFKWFEEKGLEIGFEYVASGPLVRSSYRAAEHFLHRKLMKEIKIK
ncbi:lipoyl synthase [bacterium]|nr:lipoyl synthase [bacterium]